MESRVYGIILAGGRSSRMERDKASVTLCGRSLLAWVGRRLEPQCRGLIVSRHGGDPDLPIPYPIVADQEPERAGPLAGLLAGLEWVARHDPAATHAVSVPVDIPFVPLDLVARLDGARRESGASIAVASSGGRRHPVVAIWPVTVRQDLREALEQEKLRRVGAFLDRYGPAPVCWSAESGDPFFNLNTPEDVATAEAMLRPTPRPSGREG